MAKREYTEVPIIPGAEPLYHRAGHRGILLLHGFLGSPYEMKYLASRFIDRGFTVSVPRLPGHGTSLDDMARFTGNDWFEEARFSYMHLMKECDEIFVAGLSMGGILTLLLAAEFSPKKIVLISTPWRIPDRRAILAPLVRPFAKILHRQDTEKGLADPEARTHHICYSDGVPVMGAWHLMRLIQKAMRSLPSVRADALIIQSKFDNVIPPDSHRYIAARIGSQLKEVRLVEEGNHALTADRGKEKIAELVLEFVR